MAASPGPTIARSQSPVARGAGWGSAAGSGGAEQPADFLEAAVHVRPHLAEPFGQVAGLAGEAFQPVLQGGQERADRLLAHCRGRSGWARVLRHAALSEPVELFGQGGDLSFQRSVAWVRRRRALCFAADEVLAHAAANLAKLVAEPVELGSQLPQVAAARRRPPRAARRRRNPFLRIKASDPGLPTDIE